MAKTLWRRSGRHLLLFPPLPRPAILTPARKLHSSKNSASQKRIASLLSSLHFDPTFPNSLLIDLEDDLNLARTLTSLSDAGADPSLPFRFFTLSNLHHSGPSRVRLTSSCAMAHILVSGRMNHSALRLLRDVATAGFDQELVFHTLRETSRSREVLGVLYSMLVSCYIDSGSTDTAVELMGRMRKFGFSPSTGVYASLVKVLLREKRMEMAWEVFAGMPDWDFGSKEAALCLFVREFCRHGDFKSACRLVCETGCVDIVPYTVVIDALAKSGFLREATMVLYRVIMSGVPLDSVLVSSVFDGYCRAGMLAEAEYVLDRSGRVPDVFVYNSFIFTLCRKGNAVEANERLNEMIGLGIEPDSCNYTTVMCCYCKFGRVDQSMKIFAQMLKRGVGLTIVTYTVLIEGFVKVGDQQSAEYAFSALKRDGIKPDLFVYNALINGYCKEGYLQTAHELMDAMEKDGVSPDVSTYNIIMHGLVKKGSKENVRKTFDEVVRRGFSPDKITFTNLIDSFCKERNLNEAYFTFCSMSSTGVKPDVVACSVLIDGYCEVGRMEEANGLFRKMLDFGLKPDLILYRTLVRGFCKVGDVGEACQLLTMMKKDGILPDYVIYRSLVHGFNKSGAVNAAETAAVKMEDIFRGNEIVLSNLYYWVHEALLVDGVFDDKNGDSSPTNFMNELLAARCELEYENTFLRD